MTLPRGTLMVTALLISISGIVRLVDAHCDASKARLKIKWRLDIGVAPEADATAASDTAAAVKPSEWAEQPMMIYIPTDDPKDASTAKLERVVFVNEKVAIAARFFEAIKISSHDALDDRILTGYGLVTPHIIFLKRDYTVHATLSRRQITASKLLKTMRSLVRVEYVTDFNKMIRGYARLLDELDLLEAKRKDLAKQGKRLEAAPNPVDARKLEREEETYEAAREAWEEREEQLLQLRLKAVKKAGN